jgi:hypothetical protein
MLKTLSLSPDEARDDPAAESQADDSETRMLRALEALSHAPQARSPEGQQHREQNPFRANKASPSRDNFRGDGPHHGAKARHRFVKDGEVPVVHMQPARPRDAAAGGSLRHDPEFIRLQQLLDEQRQRAELAERTRAEALNQIKTLQTKLAHSELTLADLQALAQSRLDELHSVQQELAQLRLPPPAAPQTAALPPAPGVPIKRGRGRPRKIVVPATPVSTLDEVAMPMPMPMPAPAPAPALAPPAPAPVKRGPGRPRRIPIDEPQAACEPEPVQWWLLPPKPKRRG